MRGWGLCWNFILADATQFYLIKWDVYPLMAYMPALANWYRAKGTLRNVILTNTGHFVATHWEVCPIMGLWSILQPQIVKKMHSSYSIQNLWGLYSLLDLSEFHNLISPLPRQFILICSQHQLYTAGLNRQNKWKKLSKVWSNYLEKTLQNLKPNKQIW